MFIETHCKSLVNLNHIIWITKFKQKNSKLVQVKAFPVTGKECIVLDKFASHEEADKYIQNLAFEITAIKNEFDALSIKKGGPRNWGI